MNGTNPEMERHSRCRRRPLLWGLRGLGVVVMLVGILAPIPHRMAWFWAGIVILVASGMMAWG